MDGVLHVHRELFADAAEVTADIQLGGRYRILNHQVFGGGQVRVEVRPPGHVAHGVSGAPAETFGEQHALDE